MTRCAMCDALHQENSLACEAEASAILQQRYQMISSDPPSAAAKTYPDNYEVVVSSRRQQLKIATRLQNHRALAHSA